MSSLRRSQNRHRSAIARVRRHRSEIDIEDDATLVQRFGCDIPVIYIGRKKAAKYRVNLQQFRRQLQDASEKLKIIEGN